MENGKEEKMSREAVNQPAQTPGEAIRQNLEEAMFKLLNFQAQHGADQNTTMILLALMNLLGIVNCMNRILPEGQRVRGTQDLAAQLAGMLGGAAPPPGFFQGSQGQGGIDPAMLGALAGMLGGPRGPGGPGEPGNKPGIDPAMLAALAGMMGGPGGGGANPAALMALLANMLGAKRPPEGQKPKESQAREEKRDAPEEKPKQNHETTRKDPGLPPRGILKWDPRLGSPTSSF
ncbi:hypothetical protein [Desulforamulus putei]|uniref:Uncharacterized protein n=1 Tax=Desulforamulus putei DSM 12395 TaxID=1121429 RepID=A0A1M4Z3Z2_9FIRM|nr:hypothetical protein [Desulforamulus putei]SHF12774.1 hypothetical protein SAMN02745133_01895 [Desulforamulus putei DSM 12395]